MGAGEEAAQEGEFLSFLGRHLSTGQGLSSLYSEHFILQGNLTSRHQELWADLRDIQHCRNDKTLAPTQPANK